MNDNFSGSSKVIPVYLRAKFLYATKSSWLLPVL